MSNCGLELGISDQCLDNHPRRVQTISSISKNVQLMPVFGHNSINNARLSTADLKIQGVHSPS